MSLPENETHILVVAPGDPRLPHATDVDFASTIRDLIQPHFNSSLYGFEGHSVTDRNSRRGSAVARWILRYCRYILSHKFDAILVINYNPLVILTGVLRFFSPGKPVVLMYAGSAPTRQTSFPSLSTWFLAISLSDAVAFSPSLKYVNLFRKKPNYEFPSVIIDPRVISFDPDERIRIRNALSIGNQKVVGVIGPFHPKNALSLAWLLANLESFDPDVGFMVIGECPASLQRRSPRILYVGHVRNFASYLSACDCVLIPRLFKVGAPMNKMVSSMFVGLPVVTNDAEGMDVVSGQNVILGELEDLPSLTNALLNRPDRGHSLGVSSRATAIATYSTEAVGPKVIDFLAARLGFSEPQRAK